MTMPHQGQKMKRDDFLTDIQTLRMRAREHIERGAITPGYSADRETVIRLLNEALATELVCVLRYKRHHFMAAGIHADSVSSERKRASSAGSPGLSPSTCAALRRASRQAPMAVASFRRSSQGRTSRGSRSWRSSRAAKAAMPASRERADM